MLYVTSKKTFQYMKFHVMVVMLFMLGKLDAVLASGKRTLGIWDFLTKSIAALEQLLYSPDLGSCGFLLFPKLNEVTKGTRF